MNHTLAAFGLGLFALLTSFGCASAPEPESAEAVAQPLVESSDKDSVVFISAKYPKAAEMSVEEIEAAVQAEIAAAVPEAGVASSAAAWCRYRGICTQEWPNRVCETYYCCSWGRTSICW